MGGKAVFLTVSCSLTPIEEMGDNEPLVLVDAVPSVKGWKDRVHLKHFVQGLSQTTVWAMEMTRKFHAHATGSHIAADAKID